MDMLNVPFPKSMFEELEQLAFSLSLAKGKGKHERSDSRDGGNPLNRSTTNPLGRRQSTTQKLTQSLKQVTQKRSMDLESAMVPFTHEEAYNQMYHVFHEKIDFCVKVYCPKHFEALRKLYCGPYN